jgi:hypothetical protein
MDHTQHYLPGSVMSGVFAVSPGAPDLTALFNNDEITVVISSNHLNGSTNS